jgi:hypothetical protein
VTALLQQPRDLDGFVRPDTACDAERDERHLCSVYRFTVGGWSSFETAPDRTSRSAVFTFLDAGSTRGVHPSRSCLARAPAITTNSNFDSFTIAPVEMCRRSVQPPAA